MSEYAFLLPREIFSAILALVGRLSVNAQVSGILNLAHLNTVHEVVSTFPLCILVLISQDEALLRMNHKSGFLF